MEENYYSTCMQFSNPMNCNLRSASGTCAAVLEVGGRARTLRLLQNRIPTFFSHCCCCLAEKDMLCRYVFWYHFERMVNYDLPSDSSVSVKTSTSAKGMTRSILTIKEAQPEDAGNYTCKPSNAIAASIQVFVSEGSYFIISVNLCGILVASKIPSQC